MGIWLIVCIQKPSRHFLQTFPSTTHVRLSSAILHFWRGTFARLCQFKRGNRTIMIPRERNVFVCQLPTPNPLDQRSASLVLADLGILCFDFRPHAVLLLLSTLLSRLSAVVRTGTFYYFRCLGAFGRGTTLGLMSIFLACNGLALLHLR